MIQVAAYPFNKITQGLIKNQDLIPKYKIRSVIDFGFFIGEDTGYLLSKKESGLEVCDNIERGLEGVEMLLLNDGGVPFPETERTKEIYKKNNIIEKWKKLLIKAKERNLNIVAVAGITDPRLVEWIEKNQIKLLAPGKSNKAINGTIKRYIDKNSSSKAKKIGIYGTKPCVGKYTLQMNLYRELRKIGKETRMFITEPTSFLFNQPQIWNIEANYLERESYIRALVKKSDYEGDEFIIMADQGGIKDFSSDPLYLSFTKLAMLKAYDPDRIILVSDYSDMKGIRDSLDQIRIYTGIETIDAILLPDRVETKYGEYKWKTEIEIEKMKNRIKKNFDVKEVGLISDVEKVAYKLISQES